MEMNSCKLAEQMIELMDNIRENLEAWCEKGNKSAAKRARLATLGFEKIAKDFRKLSVQESKTK